MTESYTELVEKLMLRTEVTDDGCWLYLGHRLKSGYGILNRYHRELGRSKSSLAHRYVYEAATGPIPTGAEIDHLCRNKPCWRPDHLQAVTKSQNLLRGEHPGREKTHCKYGHPLFGDNLRYNAGKRVCRTCQAVGKARWIERGRPSRV